MHLGKKLKFNMIIAILLCMAFVVNIGATLAAMAYEFKAKSSVDASAHETYIDHANVQTSSAQYSYNAGNVNNQLNINYGFSQEYDLMLKFTATYSNPSHKANDFTINFVDRNNWCVDADIVTGSSSINDLGVTVEGADYYAMNSLNNTAIETHQNLHIYSGVMYYMGTLNDSGTLPVISGVTFYTSANNSYTYIGDILTITLTAEYVKADSNYNSTHAFNSHKITQEAFDNWCAYKSKTALATSKTMIYNAYANDATALEYPSDYDWTSDGFDITEASEPLYANTAYRYAVNKVDSSSTARDYSAVIAGNRYHGGAGVYVIPASNLVTVGITVLYNWQLSNLIDGNVPTNMVEIGYNAQDITTISRTEQVEDDGGNKTTVTYNSYYYRQTIEAPTYIDVLEYIMLTAEAPYKTYILDGGYSLVISGIMVTLQEDDTATDAVETPSGWTSSAKPAYEIDNSTAQSPILVRIKDVATGSRTYNTNVSIMNNSKNAMKISQFKVSATLWHGDYSSNHSEFNKTIDAHLSSSNLIYDTTLWQVTADQSDSNIFVFTPKNGRDINVAGGYSLTVITGVVVPKQYYPEPSDTNFEVTVEDVTTQVPIEVNDLWCALDVSGVTTTTPSYAQASYTGVEVNTTGYNSVITSGSTTSIYLKNNTTQNITSVSLSNLALALIDNNLNANLNPRDRLNTTSSFSYTLVNRLTNMTYDGIGSTEETGETTSNILIKPNEMVELYTITPSQNSVIYTYDISVTLQSGNQTGDVSMVYNAKSNSGEIINTSKTTAYEFRLSSTNDLIDEGGNSNYFINPGEFVEQVVEGDTTTYYYYYKGVVIKQQCLALLKAYVSDLQVQSIAHSDTANADTYVASHNGWSAPTDWLNAMKAIYGEPDRANAVVVN